MHFGEFVSDSESLAPAIYAWYYDSPQFPDVAESYDLLKHLVNLSNLSLSLSLNRSLHYWVRLKRNECLVVQVAQVARLMKLSSSYHDANAITFVHLLLLVMLQVHKESKWRATIIFDFHFLKMSISSVHSSCHSGLSDLILLHWQDLTWTRY